MISLLFAVLIGTAHSNFECSSLFYDQSVLNKEVLGILKKANLKPDLDNLVFGVAQFVEKNGRSPNIEELSSYTKYDLQILKKYFRSKSAPQMDEIVAISKLKYPEIFRQYERLYAQAAFNYLKEFFVPPKDNVLAVKMNVSIEDLREIYGASKGPLARIKEIIPVKEQEKFINTILKHYAIKAKALGRTPTSNELAEHLQVTETDFSELFGVNRLIENFEDLFEMGRKVRPRDFKNVINVQIFNDKRLEELVSDIRTSEVIINTTAVADAKVEPFFKASVDNYNILNNGILAVRPANLETTGLDPELTNSSKTHILLSSIELSQEVILDNIKIIAKQILPLTGLDERGTRGQTRIIGAPKFHLKTVPTAENKYLPHIIATTGAITLPNYMGGKYVQERTGAMATDQHRIGALILEKTSATRGHHSIPSVGMFHLRRIRYIPEKQGFMDINKFYTAKGIETVRWEAISFGDIHVGMTDQRLLSTVIDQILRVGKPKRIYLDDLFDGKAISHHDYKNLLSLAESARKGLLDLESEIDKTAEFLDALIRESPSDTIVYVKSSNHNDWLIRWLQSGAYVNQPHNKIIATKLANAFYNGSKNPLEFILQEKMDPKIFSRIKFLKPHEKHYVGPEHRKVLMSEHGHLGVGGARAGIRTFKKGSDRSGFGHTHTYEEMNETVNYGTLSLNPMPYAEGGFSNWIHALKIVGPNGEQQVLMLLSNNEWYRNKNNPLSTPDEFFAPNYPNVLPNDYDPNYSGAGSLDQYSR